MNKQNRILYGIILVIVIVTLTSMAYIPRYVWKCGFQDAFHHKSYDERQYEYPISDYQYEQLINSIDVYKVLVPIELTIILILLIYITKNMIKQKVEEKWIDKIPIDIIVIVMLIIGISVLSIWDRYSYRYPIKAALFASIAFSILVFSFYFSMIRRRIHKNFIKNIAIIRIIAEGKNLKNYSKEVLKYCVITIGVLLFNIIVLRKMTLYFYYSISKEVMIASLFLFVIDFYYIVICANKLLEYQRIKKCLKDISEGDYTKKIQTEDKDFEDIVKSINEINIRGSKIGRRKNEK